MVVGAGIFGLAGALELRRRGWDVRLVEAGPVPAPRASSHDLGKVVRMDYGADEATTELAQMALLGWRAWNRRWSRPLFHEVGFLLLRRSPASPGDFEFESRRVLARRGVSVATLDREMVSRRFPAWDAGRWCHGHLSPQAGWAESGAVLRALVRDARRAGVKIREENPVREVETSGDRVTGVRLAGGTSLRADVVVVAAGAWTAQLVPELSPLLRPVAQPVVLFRVPDPRDWQPPAFLPWAAEIAATGWYGFPATDDGMVKVGHHGPGLGSDAGKGVPDEHVHRCRGFLSGAVPALADAPLAGRRACLYCDTPDGAFWIGPSPSVRGLVVAAGGSGHGFKFGPVLGPLVGDAVEGTSNRWGSAFRWSAARTEAPGAEAARLTADPEGD